MPYLRIENGERTQLLLSMWTGGEMGMSNLEHLIENGLCRLDEGKSYREWREIMQQDCNWEGNENITMDNLWEICQYVIFTWDSNRTFSKLF